MILLSILLALFSITSIVFIVLYFVERTKRSAFYKLKLNEPRIVATYDVKVKGTLFQWYNGAVQDRTSVIDLCYSTEIKYNPMTDTLIYNALFNRGKTESAKAQYSSYSPSITNMHYEVYPIMVEQYIIPKYGSVEELLRTARESYRKVAAEKLEWKRQMESFMGTPSHKDL